MLDRWTIQIVKPPLKYIAARLNHFKVKADHVTTLGFILGMLSIPALAMQWYELAMVLIIINRVFDGLDGELARLQGTTDAGAFLDIVLDFIFYSAVIFGFALANPEENALAASALIFSFVGTGASFLAFAIMAEKHQIQSIEYPGKGFYYITGLAEGTETIVALILFCLFPNYFSVIAWGFATVCYATAAIRVWGGYKTLSQEESVKTPENAAS